MKSLVIAPHADDEVLGVGGTLLRRKSEGAVTGLLLMTSINIDLGYSTDSVRKREQEIKDISKFFEFSEVHELKYNTRELDKIPRAELVSAVKNVFDNFKPEEIFIPHPGDVHSDHKITFEVAATCAKWFRSPSVKRILAYETLSETEFGLLANSSFNPTYFINIENFLEKKLKAMQIYTSELESFPFPRSIEAIKALSRIRGSNSGYPYAEAFELLRERT